MCIECWWESIETVVRIISVIAGVIDIMMFALIGFCAISFREATIKLHPVFAWMFIVFNSIAFYGMIACLF